MLVLRGACYLALLSISPWSLLWIFCAHGMMLTILRIYDCFHHTFEIIALGTPMPRLERDYEQRNTYSSVISREHAWLNRIFSTTGFITRTMRFRTHTGRTWRVSMQHFTLHHVPTAFICARCCAATIVIESYASSMGWADRR